MILKSYPSPQRLSQSHPHVFVNLFHCFLSGFVQKLCVGASIRSGRFGEPRDKRRVIAAKVGSASIQTLKPRLASLNLCRGEVFREIHARSEWLQTHFATTNRFGVSISVAFKIGQSTSERSDPNSNSSAFALAGRVNPKPNVSAWQNSRTRRRKHVANRVVNSCQNRFLTAAEL